LHPSSTHLARGPSPARVKFYEKIALVARADLGEKRGRRLSNQLLPGKRYQGHPFLGRFFADHHLSYVDLYLSFQIYAICVVAGAVSRRLLPFPRQKTGLLTANIRKFPMVLGWRLV